MTTCRFTCYNVIGWTNLAPHLYQEPNVDRDAVRAAVADAIGSPSSGPLADAVDRITDAVLAAGKPQREKRVVEPDETRGE